MWYLPSVELIQHLFLRFVKGFISDTYINLKTTSDFNKRLKGIEQLEWNKTGLKGLDKEL